MEGAAVLPLPLIPVLKKFKVLSLSNAPILRGIKPEDRMLVRMLVRCGGKKRSR